MLEIIGYIVSGCITFLSVFIGVKYAQKKLTEELEDKIFDVLESEEGQKLVYSIGVLLGNGIKSGVGFKGSRGKFKWQDLIGYTIAQFIQSKLPVQQGATETNINPYEKIFRGEQ